MNVDAFIDTNVLMYAAAGRHDAPTKWKRAWSLLDKAEFGLSGQVLAEFYVNAVKKPQVPLTPAEAAAWVDRLSTVPIVPVDADLVQQAIVHAQRFRISYWDAALISAAERLEAHTLYTEDLNDNQLYGSVRVVNPFRIEEPTERG
jgi:predicted nucleic acid-binding protein